jgi:hypothetical protein
LTTRSVLTNVSCAGTKSQVQSNRACECRIKHSNRVSPLSRVSPGIQCLPTRL